MFVTIGQWVLRGLKHGRLNGQLAANANVVASVTSIGLRASVLLGKFAFMVVLANFADTATVGIYALLVTISTIAVYAIGLEIHTFTGREVVLTTDDGRSRHIQSHLLTLLGVYALAIPIILACVVWLNLSGKFVFAVFAIVVLLETMAQELGRYLLMLSRPVASNFLQFLRGAAWMPVPTAAMIKGHGAPIVDFVLWSWVGGLLAACLFGFWCLRRYFVSFTPPRLTWLRQALVSSRFYLGVAILTQVQYYSDRFVVQYFMGEAAVGVLAFYQSFASTIVTFVQTGVITILLPRLILAANTDDSAEEDRVLRSMLGWALALAAAISASLALGMPSLLDAMGKSAYQSGLPIFFVLLFGNLLLVVGVVVHLTLYARRRDLQLLKVSLVVVPLGLIANSVAVPVFGLWGAAVIFVIVAAVDLLAKYWLFRRMSFEISRRRNGAIVTALEVAGEDSHSRAIGE